MERREAEVRQINSTWKKHAVYIQIINFEHEKIGTALENRHSDDFGNFMGTTFGSAWLE